MTRLNRKAALAKQLAQRLFILPCRVVLHDDLASLLVHSFDPRPVEAVNALRQADGTPHRAIEPLDRELDPRRIFGGFAQRSIA